MVVTTAASETTMMSDEAQMMAACRPQRRPAISADRQHQAGQMK